MNINVAGDEIYVQFMGDYWKCEIVFHTDGYAGDLERQYYLLPKVTGSVKDKDKAKAFIKHIRKICPCYSSSFLSKAEVRKKTQ